ncbi:hypothetical protein L1987_54354 [Smallanthus sonchifolius]|uniref:Uncharacterized protein n=1 Tax=Smallanthus sonchifolius TaxID=185202 RepID=A0ACB9E6E2_9ASTR|nr:hypothetical protein L1987_54354 [Smallanthus sonchifolius]
MGECRLPRKPKKRPKIVQNQLDIWCVLESQQGNIDHAAQGGAICYLRISQFEECEGVTSRGFLRQITPL